MDKRLSYPVLLDTSAEVTARYQVRGIPTILVLDRAGKVVYRGYQLPPTSVLKPLL